MRGPTIPHRSRPAANPESAATASGSGIASGFAYSTHSPVVARTPRLTFSARRRGRSFSIRRASGGRTGGAEPGRFATTTSSSTCRASAGSNVSSSSACPCETTTAETFTSPEPPRRPGRWREPSPPSRRRAPARSPPRRAARARRSPGEPRPRAGLGDDDRRLPGDLDERRVGDRHDGRARRHGLDDREPEPLVPRRLDEAGRTAIERGEPLHRHVPLDPRTGVAQLPREALVLRRADDDELEPRPARRLERRTLVLPLLDRSDGERVGRLQPTLSPSGANAGSTPFGVTTTWSGGSP